MVETSIPTSIHWELCLILTQALHLEKRTHTEVSNASMPTHSRGTTPYATLPDSGSRARISILSAVSLWFWGQNRTEGEGRSWLTETPLRLEKTMIHGRGGEGWVGQSRSPFIAAILFFLNEVGGRAVAESKWDAGWVELNIFMGLVRAEWNRDSRAPSHTLPGHTPDRLQC